MNKGIYPEWERFIETKQSPYFNSRPEFPMLNEDTPTFMGAVKGNSIDDIKGSDAVIIGAPYVATSGEEYMGVSKYEWIAAPKRVRQQSIRYRSGYIQDFDLDLFEKLNIVDYGDADIPPEVMENQSPENILKAQQAVEKKVSEVLSVNAVPIVIGQNSPCGSYAIAKPIAEHTDGPVGCISLDTHWDAETIDFLTKDPRIAGSESWKHKMYEFHENMHPRHLVEIGERGMLEDKQIIRSYLKQGTRFISSWELRTSLGIDGLIKELDRAYDGTKSVYVHFDMDVMGGAGPAPGDILGEASEPIGLTDYEVIRIAHEIGKKGLGGLSFICIPPGSPLVYRCIVYVIMYLLAGIALEK